ncbi:MAG: ankyrin repeat domain-containing protein [Azoarcus sp.]|jgi:hypothetical protein|nr:ankyrin repeat domain-containing protein [Azoarcus sp.]
MAHIPSFEEILTEVHARLGLKALPNKGRFINGELKLDSFVERGQQLLEEVFDALELGGEARLTARISIVNQSSMLKSIELCTWTGNASQRQVLWTLLARIYVPMWAREIAFWASENIEHGLPAIDAGMPGGEFWFFPIGDAGEILPTGEIKLPVSKVLNWLLDLLGESSFEKLSSALGNKKLREKEGGNDTVVRTLRNWQSDGLPKSNIKIEEIFPDDAELTFKGALKLNAGMSPETQFENALALVIHDKALSVEQLSHQIPMTPEQLRPIFEKTASVELKLKFVQDVSIRYSVPSMAMIRQRLRVSRLMQSGYQDLVKFLCPDLKPEDAHNPTQNKVLQLVALFSDFYNKTIESLKHGDSWAKRDEWFRNQSMWEGFDLLPQIFYPFDFIDTKDCDSQLRFFANRLSYYFFSLEPEQELEDIYVCRKIGIAAPLHPSFERMKHIENMFGEYERIKNLLDRVNTSSPYRALQSEDNFWVLHQFAQFEGLNEKNQKIAWDRMAEVASSPLERGCYRLLELDRLLNGNAASWPKDVRSIAKEKLDAAEADADAWNLWKAPMLHFKGRHALFENRFDDAENLFKSALDACSERNFGSLCGGIAYDAFAVSINRTALNRKNHEPYYRNILGFMELQNTESSNGVPSFEDVATDVEDFFWTTLYQPYPGLEPIKGNSRKNCEDVFENLICLSIKGDWKGVKAYFNEKEKLFRNSDLKDARRSSVLMALLKIRAMSENSLPNLHAKMPFGLMMDIYKVEQIFRNNWPETIRLLLDAWPEQARIADFKGQTPLMLAAENGDFQLVELLLPLSDIDAQDYLGRTPLRAAVTGRSLDCLGAVLALNPDVLRVGQEGGSTAAHIAVSFAWVEGLRMLLSANGSKGRATDERPWPDGASSRLGASGRGYHQKKAARLWACAARRARRGHGAAARDRRLDRQDAAGAPHARAAGRVRRYQGRRRGLIDVPWAGHLHTARRFRRQVPAEVGLPRDPGRRPAPPDTGGGFSCAAL